VSTDDLTVSEVRDGAAPPAPTEPAVHDGVAVRCIGLTKRYGDLFAVRDLNLEVKRGSIFGLIGPNGAGKSTTFSILASLLAPTAGRVEVAGFDPATHAREVRRRMGYMPDVLGLYDDLKVAEYLEFFAASYGVASRDRPALIDGLLDLVDLSGKRDAMVDTLSRGMKQRLSLARALVHDPEVLILDEPASGLDPRARVELRGLLHELRDMG
jgi:ABC-2 type transport system ATP-binding protein